jgi:hypothetical protein
MHGMADLRPPLPGMIGRPDAYQSMQFRKHAKMWTPSLPRCAAWLAVAATVAAATTPPASAHERGLVIVPLGVPVVRPGYSYPPPPPVYVYSYPYAYAYPSPPPVAYVVPPSPSAPSPPACREYETDATIAGRTQPAYGTACLQPDGSWRIVR